MIIDCDYQSNSFPLILKTTRSAETMLADLYCCFNSAEFFHVAFSASAYQASNELSLLRSLPCTLFFTNRFKVPRAITLT